MNREPSGVRRRHLVAVCAPAALLLGLLTGCGGGSDGEDATSPSTTGSSSSAPAADAADAPASKDASPGEQTGRTPDSDAPFAGRRVVAVSIDGLNPRALRRLGPRGVPTYFRLLEHGASTVNARSEFERTETLPNHTGMVTGRPIDRANDGHGVTWNYERPRATVQQAAGHDVASVFTQVHDAGGTTAVFAGKSKFGLFANSWPDAIDRSVVTEPTARMIDDAVADIAAGEHTFTFVHLPQPDEVGHVKGWLSPRYLDAVTQTDAVLARILRAIDEAPPAPKGTVLVLTADHGGLPGRTRHAFASLPDDYTIPFAVYGPGIAAGDLYDLVRGVRDPGGSRPGYDGVQPVRNCDVANVALGLLDLPAVPGSSCDADERIARDLTRNGG